MSARGRVRLVESETRETGRERNPDRLVGGRGHALLAGAAVHGGGAVVPRHHAAARRARARHDAGRGDLVSPAGV
eukprot:636031-Pyramimonas_sp.AAC.1